MKIFECIKSPSPTHFVQPGGRYEMYEEDQYIVRDQEKNVILRNSGIVPKECLREVYS